jgi:hypothetical protein
MVKLNISTQNIHLGNDGRYTLNLSREQMSAVWEALQQMSDNTERDDPDQAKGAAEAELADGLIEQLTEIECRTFDSV